MNVDYFESVEISDIGKMRKKNEDACLRIQKQGIYCVADGMGVAGGDLASRAITACLKEAFEAAKITETFRVEVNLCTAAINKASKWIKTFADEQLIDQMGSTVVTLIFDPRRPSRGLALHAGDSRLYRYRNGKLKLLTADHTAMAALSAKLGRDPASLPAKYQSELVRAVGLDESVTLEHTAVEARKRDLFLLCSDGLTSMVSDEEIAKLLSLKAMGTLDEVAQALIDSANEAGGQDNITVLLVRTGTCIESPPLSPRLTSE